MLHAAGVQCAMLRDPRSEGAGQVRPVEHGRQAHALHGDGDEGDGRLFKVDTRERIRSAGRIDADPQDAGLLAQSRRQRDPRDRELRHVRDERSHGSVREGHTYDLVCGGVLGEIDPEHQGVGSAILADRDVEKVAPGFAFVGRTTSGGAAAPERWKCDGLNCASRGEHAERSMTRANAW